VWVWSDGSGTLKFDIWQTGQPDNAAGVGAPQNCAVYDVDDRADDRACSVVGQTYPFICSIRTLLSFTIDTCHR